MKNYGFWKKSVNRVKPYIRWSFETGLVEIEIRSAAVAAGAVSLTSSASAFKARAIKATETT